MIPADDRPVDDRPADEGSADERPAGTITVSGRGQVEVTPDALRLELAVEASAAGVADALAAARQTMAEVRRAVLGAGVAPADQQTSGLNLWQRHDGNGRPDGYQASESLAVLLRDPSVVDVVLQVAGEAAGDRLRVGGGAFTVLDPGAARDEARRLALAEAERVATVYADAAGRTLGGLVSLAEGGGQVTGRRLAKVAAMAMDSGMEAGTQSVGVDVTAEWVLR